MVSDTTVLYIIDAVWLHSLFLVIRSKSVCGQSTLIRESVYVPCLTVCLSHCLLVSMLAAITCIYKSGMLYHRQHMTCRIIRLISGGMK